MDTPDPDSTVGVAGRLRQRLDESGKTADELAAAMVVPVAYVRQLLNGRRRLPPPSRTDLYPKITTFFKLGRGELERWVETEHTEAKDDAPTAPGDEVCQRLLALCEPDTARAFQRRGRNEITGEQLAGYIERILQATKRAAHRILKDQTALRIAADRDGQTLATRRVEILDFLETSAGTLSVDHVERFVTPYLARWDVDLDTGVLRVFMQP